MLTRFRRSGLLQRAARLDRILSDFRWPVPVNLDESKIGSVDEFAVGGGTLRRLSGSPVSLPTAIALAGIVVS